MNKITLQTTANIDFNAWVSQAKRFAKITDKVKYNNLPLDVELYGVATIDIVYEKPLSSGFWGEITYTQHYKKRVEHQEFDEMFNPTVTTIKEVEATHKVIEYTQVIDRNTIEYLIDQTLALIPESVTGYFNREQKAIEMICLKNAQDFYTFNLASDQIVIK